MSRDLRPSVSHRAATTQRATLLFKRCAVVALLASGLTACNRAPTAAQLEDLAIEVPDLMPPRGENRDIPATQWQPALRALKPERVYANAQGLYIVTGSFFVQERGLHVPREASTVNTDPGRDPSYRAIGLGFYAYSIEG